MHITFLHTARTHIDTFAPLLKSIDDSIASTHLVEEALLEEAQKEGETAVLQQKIAKIVHSALNNNTDTILCTCSTIGKMAESIAPGRVLRVDRPMLEEAFQIGGRIRIAATLESTIKPTLDLLTEVAGNSAIDVDLVVISEAWPHFERGDLDLYYQTIGAKLQEIAKEADVIILAQASMAGATKVVDVDCPVLSSPELGIQAIVQRAKAA